MPFPGRSDAKQARCVALPQRPPVAAHQGQDWGQTARGRRPERPITAPGIPSRADAVVCGPSCALGGALTGPPLPARLPRSSASPRPQRSPRPAPSASRHLGSPISAAGRPWLHLPFCCLLSLFFESWICRAAPALRWCAGCPLAAVSGGCALAAELGL